MIRGEPPAVGAFVAGSFTAEEMPRRYCTLVFAQTGNYQETARRLGIDRRTVKEKRIDPALLEQLTGGRWSATCPFHRSRLKRIRGMLTCHTTETTL